MKAIESWTCEVCGKRIHADPCQHCGGKLGGHDLREAVAVKIMGWAKQKVGVLHEGVMFQRAGSYPTPLVLLPAYESSIAANEEMVRKMIDDGWTLTEHRTKTMYECKWRRGNVERKGLIVGALKHDDVSEVRASAALAAVEAK